MGDGYNGWANYETWCVNLWLANDEGTDEQVRALVADVLGDDRISRREDLYNVSGSICDYVSDLAEQTCPGVLEGASFVCDLFAAALGEVDWFEIAEAFVSDLAESAR